jgi:Fe2+ or Zn2+ uptake regulation protein
MLMRPDRISGLGHGYIDAVARAASGADQTEQVLDLLRAHGGRVTTARRAIVHALLDHEGHPTAEELTARVHAAHPDVDKSTVYRFLDELERLDVVDHVHLGHGPAVYHLATDAHQHLVCEVCGDVTEVPASVLSAFRRTLLSQFGFELDVRHFALQGRCRDCDDPAGAPSPAS